MNEGDNGKTPPTSPHEDHYEETINFYVKTSHIEVKLAKTPSIKTDGFIIFDSSDLDNFLLINDLKKGEMPKFICKKLAEEIGSTPEEVSKAYSAAVNDATQPLGSGTLNPDAWFAGEDETKKFVPYDCARDYLRVFPHVVTEYGGLIHQFAGKHWLKDAEALIYTTIEGAGKGVIRPRQIGEAVDSLRNLTRIVDPEKLDVPMEKIFPLPRHHIPISNGILDLVNKTVSPFSPDNFYTETLPRTYIPGVEPQIFIEFLNKIFVGDPNAETKKTQIFETIAWCLMMDYSLQGAVILYGQGGEGKSILHDVVAATIVHTTSISLKELEQDKYKRAELYGSWANLISESSTDIIISEWFKRVTDGTTITAERKNKPPFQFSSHAKLILDVNELPVEEGQLRAFYRRVPLIIDFHNMLEDVLNPHEIDDFVKKLKDPAELDRIFSYVVDNFYGPLVSRMKFTGHLNLAEAEQKWVERSNPALSFLQAKHVNGDILNDTEDVKAVLDLTLLSRYITTEKDGTEYLTMVKQDVVNAAQQWAVKRGFPAKTINGGSLGKALVSLGFPNETVNKRINATTFLKAWKNIFIDLRDEIDSIHVTGVAGPENLPPHPQTQSRIGGFDLCDGSFSISPTCFEKKINIEGERESTCHINSKPLGNSQENTVTADSGHPSHNRHMTTEAQSFAPTKSGAQSETQPITEKDGKLTIVQLLNLGYHIDPNSGPDINRKFFVIRIAGFSSLSSEMKEKLLFIMAKEHFTMAAGGSHSAAFARPLSPTADSVGNSVQSDPETIRYEIVDAIRTEAPKSQYGSLTPDAVYKIIGGRFQDIRVAEIKEICEQEYNKGTLIRRGPGYFYNSEGA